MEYKIKTIAAWLGTGSINIFGLPFSGKDTQASRLAEVFSGVVLSSGDLLRQSKDNQELQKKLAAGEIIPSSLFKQIVIPYFSREDFQSKPLILSEVGRLRGEDEVILEATKTSGHPTKAVILLDLEDKEVWRRFDESQVTNDRGNRADDNRSVLQTRLDNYQAKVMPVIEFYRQQHLLLEVDGALPRDDVFKSIIDSLHKKATNS